MRSYADERCAGRYPDGYGRVVHSIRTLAEAQIIGWGTVIGSLPDLRGLELVLDTFTDKKQQLKNVVECASMGWDSRDHALE